MLRRSYVCSYKLAIYYNSLKFVLKNIQVATMASQYLFNNLSITLISWISSSTNQIMARIKKDLLIYSNTYILRSSLILLWLVTRIVKILWSGSENSWNSVTSTTISAYCSNRFILAYKKLISDTKVLARE